MQSDSAIDTTSSEEDLSNTVSEKSLTDTSSGEPLSGVITVTAQVSSDFVPNDLPYRRNDLRPSLQAVNVLEAVIIDYFAGNKERIIEAISKISGGTTSTVKYYNDVYDFIEKQTKIEKMDDINDVEKSAHAMEFIRRTGEIGQSNEFKIASETIFLICFLIAARRKISEDRDYPAGLLIICQAYASLINPVEIEKSIKAISISNSVRDNAIKGGKAKARKSLLVVNEAIRLIEEMRPSTGYRNRIHATRTIQDRLVEFIKISNISLSEGNYNDRMKRWFNKYPELFSALQLLPRIQNDAPRKEKIKLSSAVDHNESVRGQVRTLFRKASETDQSSP